MNSKKILVIDDDQAICEMLKDALGMAGYEVVASHNAAEGMLTLKKESPALCILDINLPDLDGFSFLQTLRGRGDTTPILMLTARQESEDLTRGLREGADDYLRKPFQIEELILRIGSILRRSSAFESSEVLKTQHVSLDIGRHQAWVKGDEVYLSATEFALLEDLIRHRGKLRSKEALLQSVWGIGFSSSTTVVETYISYLRRKIHREGFEPIVTLRGVGYKYLEEAS